MADAKDDDAGKPADGAGSGGQGGQGGQSGSTSSTPAAEDVKRQDKTKDKPDSGQNEDG